MSRVHFWDGRSGLCGTLLRIEPSNKPHRKNLIPRERNKWFGSSQILADIPDSALLTFDSSSFPALGTDSLVLIIADRDGNSPLLEKLNYHYGILSEQLSQSKEREQAAMSAKEVAEWQKSESAKDVGDRIVNEIERLKKLTSPDSHPFQRRGVMG
jgi:hypothetical protein